MFKNSMEKDWDARAREDAMHYIVVRKTPQDEGEFFKKGTREVYRLCSELFLKKGFEPKGKRMLDIGCGIGRLDRGFSEMFTEVWGIDVSGEMVSQAIKLNQSIKNVKFVKVNGRDLSPFPDEFFDFVFSHLTFQHIPDRGTILNYFSEVYRVLKPGGLFKIQLRRPWAGVALAFGLFPIPRSIFPYVPEAVWAIYGHLALRGKRKLYRGKTWRGSGISETEIEQALLRLEFEAVEIVKDEPSKATFWCCGKKSR